MNTQKLYDMLHAVYAADHLTDITRLVVHRDLEKVLDKKCMVALAVHDQGSAFHVGHIILKIPLNS